MSLPATDAGDADGLGRTAGFCGSTMGRFWRGLATERVIAATATDEVIGIEHAARSVDDDKVTMPAIELHRCVVVKRDLRQQQRMRRAAAIAAAGSTVALIEGDAGTE